MIRRLIEKILHVHLWRLPELVSPAPFVQLDGTVDARTWNASTIALVI